MNTDPEITSKGLGELNLPQQQWTRQPLRRSHSLSFCCSVHSGTTLNLLKFPIMNPTPYRLFRRQQRLNAASKQTEAELPQDELRRLKHLSRKGYLIGKMAQTGVHWKTTVHLS